MDRCQAERYCKSYNEERSNCHEFCIGYVQIRNIYALSNIPKRYQHFMPLVPDEEDRKSFLFLRDFQNDIISHISEGHGLFIYSKTKGNGKTSWACKIVGEYFRHVAMTNNLRCRGLFVNLPKFFEDLKRNMDDPSEDMREFEESIKSADIVIWDDIGAQTDSKWVRQKLYEFINYRESNDKSQIFTSNVPLEELSDESHLGERIVDRIRGQCAIVEFTGVSRRDATWAGDFNSR